MVDAPEKLWMTAEEQGWPRSFRSFRLSDLEHPEEYPAYVRDDLYEQVKRDLGVCQHDNAQYKSTVEHLKARAEAAERLAGTQVTSLRELISSYRYRFTDEKADYQRGILDTLDNIEMVLDGTHDAGPLLAEPAGEAAPEPVAYPKIMYVCEHCHEHNPEMCGHDRTDIYVTPDGQWLCDGCLDEEGVPHRDCVSPPTLYTSPVATPPASAIREAAEMARACLAGLVSAGHNYPPPEPEQIENAFWELDKALAGAKS